MEVFFAHIEEIMALAKQAVKTAEESTASGEAKRAAAIAMVIQLATAFGLDLTPYESLIGSIIDGIVFVYNMLHIFDHKKSKVTTTK